MCVVYLLVFQERFNILKCSFPYAHVFERKFKIELTDAGQFLKWQLADILPTISSNYCLTQYEKHQNNKKDYYSK